MMPAHWDRDAGRITGPRGMDRRHHRGGGGDPHHERRETFRHLTSASVRPHVLQSSYMEWSDLLWPATSRCELAGPKPCGLLIGDIDDGEATEILGDIGIPTFAEVQFAAGLVSTESLAQVFIYSRGEDEHARLLHLRDDCPGQRPTGLKPLFGVITDPLLVEVDNVVRHVISCYLRPEELAPVDHRYFACSAYGP